MALFFDAAWFNARLIDLRLDRAALAASAGLDWEGLELIFNNEREVSAAEIRAFAVFLRTDTLEISIRCGVARRGRAPGEADTGARLEQLNARLDAIDLWIAEFERETRKSASGG